MVAVNPVNGLTTHTVRHTRTSANVSMTRCSLHFLGPLSRRLLRRINGGFRRVMAVRSKVVGKNVKYTVLRFVTSGKCCPRVEHVNMPSRFVRRKSIRRLCRLYKVSRRKVCGMVAGGGLQVSTPIRDYVTARSWSPGAR